MISKSGRSWTSDIRNEDFLFLYFSGSTIVLWFTNVFHVHVVMPADTVPCRAYILAVPVAASPDRIALVVVHLCPSARPQYLARQRRQRFTTHDNADRKKRQEF